jgi:hypothetical protein
MRWSQETQFASGSDDDLFLHKSIKHAMYTSRPQNNMGFGAMASNEKASAWSKAFQSPRTLPFVGIINLVSRR